MDNALKYLRLNCCSIQDTDLSCLAMSKHAQTLLQLDHIEIDISNDLEEAGLITLSQNLTNVKVIFIYLLESLSSNTVSSLVKAFTDSDSLEFLDIVNTFSIATTTLILDGLAQLQSLRYLHLFKRFHDVINKCRHSPLNISWSS